MSRISNTIQLAKASWRVLKADKELVVLPVFSAIATLIVAAGFVVPVVFASGDTGEVGTAGYVLLFVMYVVLAYVTIFFNAALIHAAHQRMHGGDPTVGSALRGAASHAGRILPWAVVSATVSVILRAIEERAGIVGRIAAGIAGIAWSLVTFLVLPVLIIEGIGVGDAVRRAGELFKRTWGENVAAQIGFGLLGFLLALPGVALVVAAVGLGGGAAAVLIVAGILWIIVVTLIMAALNGIFQTALYLFAAEGRVPGGFFDGVSFNDAFAPKRGVGFIR
jgi:hypothetical protein